MTVTARWEWRAFGDAVGVADARLASLTPDRVEDSDEVYLLSHASDASVKLRGGRLDAKRLLQIDEDGLEQWTPVLKAAFPLVEADLALVLELLGVDDASAGGAEDVAALLAIAAADPDLRALEVHKRREHYTLGGCMVERSELRTQAGAIRTFAVEATDPARVSAAVRELGLEALPVMCVARGLKALAGMGGRRWAVVDVGTNSVKFHVGDQDPQGRWRKVVDRAVITRLGERQTPDGRLDTGAIARTVDAIVAMVRQAHRLGVTGIAAVGTAGLRRAPNAAELIDAVRARCGVEVEILPAQEEARLAYVAATHGLVLGGGSLVVFDTGGGSSQFTFVRDGRVDERFSVNIGAVGLTERHGLDGVTSRETLDRVLREVEDGLSRLRGHEVPLAVVGMGGAVTNLAAVQLELEVYDPDVIHGSVLGRPEVERQIALYAADSAEERRTIPGLQPNRAEVILAGACIVRTALTMLGADALTISDRGLRHGLLAERATRAAAST